MTMNELIGVFILLIVLLVGIYFNTQEQSISRCYSVVGKNNITKEQWDDWQQHAYINDTLVCAHGIINKDGLREEVVLRPFPSIQVVNAT